MADKKLAPIADQGRQASELGLSHADCPYADGDNRDAWIEAFDDTEAAKALEAEAASPAAE